VFDGGAPPSDAIALKVRRRREEGEDDDDDGDDDNDCDVDDDAPMFSPLSRSRATMLMMGADRLAMTRNGRNGRPHAGEALLHRHVSCSVITRDKVRMMMMIMMMMMVTVVEVVVVVMMMMMTMMTMMMTMTLPTGQGDGLADAAGRVLLIVNEVWMRLGGI
jgi:hypothetical protein